MLHIFAVMQQKHDRFHFGSKVVALKRADGITLGGCAQSNRRIRTECGLDA